MRWRQSIKDLMEDARTRLRLGQAGRATFESSFTRKALLPKYAEVIANLPRLVPGPMRTEPLDPGVT